MSKCKLSAVFLFFGFLLVLAGCGTNRSDGSSSAKSGGIVAKLKFNPSSGTLKKTLALAPSSVATISVSVSGQNITTIQQSFTASAGTGTIAGIPAGTGLTVTFKGLDSAGNVLYLGTVNNVSIMAGQNTDLGDVTLQEQIFSLSGTVTSGGAGLAGVTITINLSNNNKITQITDSNGSYAFPSMHNGVYAVSAYLNGYTMSQSSQSVTVNGTNVGNVNFSTNVLASGYIVTVASVVPAPFGVATDAQGNLYIPSGSFVYKLDSSSGTLTTVAGNISHVGTYYGDNGPAISAGLKQVMSVALDNSGNMYLADYGDNRIRKVDAASGVITTIAGNGIAGFSGDNGPALSANFYQMHGIAVDKNNNIYVSDAGNNRIRKIDSVTNFVTTIAGNGITTYNNIGDNSLATSANFAFPSGVALDSNGNIYICDTYHNVIRKIDVQTGIITTVAGSLTSYGYTQAGYSGDNGPATSAMLRNPYGLAVDGIGNIFIADYGNNRIRKVEASTGTITTVAGNGYSGYSGDYGLATAANLYDPEGVAVDNKGNLYIADTDNSKIREVLH